MNRIIRLVGIAVCAALPVVSQAQTSTARPISFGVMGGASVPVGDFGDGADLGFTLGAHLLLAPTSMPALGFRVDATYDRWALKGVGASVVDGNSSTLGLMGNVILKSSSAMTIKPYVIGGLGLLSSNTSGSVAGVKFSGDRDNNLGVQAGGGLEFQLSGFTTFIEAKFVNAFAKDGNDNRRSVNWIPVTFGIRF